MSKHNNLNGRIFIGAILIIVGTLIFLKNIHLDLFFIDIFSWPFILLIIGIFVLINDKNSLPGIILIVVGGTNIVAGYFNVSFYDIISEYWPFIIIALGIFIVLKSIGYKNEKGENIIEEEDYYLDTFSIFSNNDRYIKSKNFKGGKITSLLGELKINLMESDIQESPQICDMLTLLGSIEIYLPPDWEVIHETTTIFGDFSDTRSKQQIVNSNNKKVLVVKGLVLFGNCEIKS